MPGRAGSNRKEAVSLRQTIRFNEDWKFLKGEAAGAHAEDYDDSLWRSVRLPHDWSIEEPFDPEHRPSNGYLPQGVCWYRRTFRPERPSEKILLAFEGVYMDSRIWVNGMEAGRHVYGYSGFELDITPYVRTDAPNVVAVRVDSTSSLCRWYSGSGIYRQVRLTLADRLRLETGGTYIFTRPIEDGAASVTVRNEIRNDDSAAKRFTLETHVTGPDGRRIEAAAAAVTAATAEPNGTVRLTQHFVLPDARLWSVGDPALYEVHTVLKDDNGAAADSRRTAFGIREAVFDKDRGFVLNGESIKLKGVCLHHDGGCLGAAVPARSWERRLELLKEMGCNAIRTAHNPPAEEFLALCDRMGFLVIDEFYDSWKFTHDGGNRALIEWDDWWEDDLRSSVRRDRNHPSVVLWSVGNELPNQGSAEMIDVMRRLIEAVREEDPGRPVTCALAPRSFDSVQEKVDHVLAMSPYMDVVSLNYQEPLYDMLKAADPNMIIVGTETFIYYRNKLQSSPGPSYDASNPWFDVVSRDYVAGQFIWAGIDYLGEAMFWTDRAGWPNKGWSGALADGCGFRKPISYFHESVWSDRPMVHIAVFDDASPITMRPPLWSAPKMVSHWTLPHRRTQMVKLVTFTNCESVELLLNGQSCGVQRSEDWPDRMMIWHVPYGDGTIRAIGRNGDTEVARHELATAGTPVRLQLKADRAALSGDSDLSHVEIAVTDDNGLTVPDANHLITFSIEGEGELAGLDNGDLLSDESYKGNARRAFMGRCLAIVRPNGGKGRIVLSAAAEGLDPAEIAIEVH